MPASRSSETAGSGAPGAMPSRWAAAWPLSVLPSTARQSLRTRSASGAARVMAVVVTDSTVVSVRVSSRGISRAWRV
ncbi:hypothetical protein BG846_02366 [Streptomyces fradiae ATCC 10745 = DSM 40063]|uniref:Uncharacterized protein n=1 Tax=Streptomyces fradiae ATCC 10745 = DSM 40063 TaxID=1319510 RepID=A0A1Y2NWR7_STRFR|nr:hypothetical protein BG846_02366 [Streptomyces fradiae ATCC 10745 = DSM 40063]